MLPNLGELPQGLPAPIDDGACAHLLGLPLPSVMLPATIGPNVDLSALSGRAVVYCYPMTGQPGCPLPDRWDEIPGARGCTPQACAFRDHYRELQALETAVFGLSVQDTAWQQEAAARLHLPFPLLSDAKSEFGDTLRLPRFEVAGLRLLKRLTLIAENGKIVKVFYPVFPPNRNADDVLEWLRGH